MIALTRTVFRRYLLAGWALAVIYGGTSAVGAAGATGADVDLAAVDAYVQSQMRAERLPGLALAIVQGSRLVHLRGFGTAGPDRGPVTPQTPFLLASLTKSFTALAIMQLVEAGKIRLDAPVQQYLPWFRVADDAASARISVRHLIHHTSGLPTDADRPRAGITLQDRVRALKEVKLARPVGGAYLYSSANYQVLGVIIEVAARQSYEEYVLRRIFAPLEMRDSSASEQDAAGKGVADGHHYWFGFPFATGLSYDRGRVSAGYLFSSAEDLSRYLIAQLNGGRYRDTSLISPAGLAALHRPAAAFNSDSWYGMGWRIGPINGIPSIWHSGNLPHFQTCMVLVPAGRWGIVVLANAANALRDHAAIGISTGITSLLMDREPPSTNTLGPGMLGLAIAVGIAALLALEVREFAKLRQLRLQLSRRGPGSLVLVPRFILPVAWEGALPLALLVGIPWLFVPWSFVVQSVPDVGCGLIAILAVRFVRGVIRVLAFASAES